MDLGRRASQLLEMRVQCHQMLHCKLLLSLYHGRLSQLLQMTRKLLRKLLRNERDMSSQIKELFKVSDYLFFIQLPAKLIGKLEDGTVFIKKGHDHTDPFEFKTDKEQVIDGLDRAVVTMKKGEVTLLTVAPEYAFGSTESTQELAVVPPNSTVSYEIELVAFVKDKESWDMNTEEKIEAASKKKEEGRRKCTLLILYICLSHFLNPNNSFTSILFHW